MSKMRYSLTDYTNDSLIKTWDNPSWNPLVLRSLKQSNTVSVVIPALNEANTIGSIVEELVALPHGLVDEVVVIDSGSTDTTIKVATKAGANVFKAIDILPQIPPIVGKGEALWRSLTVARGDILIFLDADITNKISGYITALLGPILCSTDTKLVKGYYQRPLQDKFDNKVYRGGRVTELVARPLLSVMYPELTGIFQPLSGEFATWKHWLREIDFPTDYGVDISLLLDCLDKFGIASIQQVNLGLKKHRNRPLDELSLMSRQVISTVLQKKGFLDVYKDYVWLNYAAKDDLVNITPTKRVYRPSWNSLN